MVVVKTKINKVRGFTKFLYTSVFYTNISTFCCGNCLFNCIVINDSDKHKHSKCIAKHNTKFKFNLHNIYILFIIAFILSLNDDDDNENDVRYYMSIIFVWYVFVLIYYCVIISVC